MSKINFTRINNDVNGNPRYVVHFLQILTPSEKEGAINTRFYETYGLNAVSQLYALAVQRSHKIGGRRYHTRAYGGGIVFSTYNTTELEKDIKALIAKAEAEEK